MPSSTPQIFRARLTRAPGAGDWVFVEVPEALAPPVTHGWGRTPVTATVNGQRRETSVWTGKDGRTYLPVAKPLRRGLAEDAVVEVSIELRLG